MMHVFIVMEVTPSTKTVDMVFKSIERAERYVARMKRSDTSFKYEISERMVHY